MGIVQLSKDTDEKLIRKAKTDEGKHLPKITASVATPEAMRAMMEAILHILSKDKEEKPAKKAKGI
jgi:hypothetical protein